MELVSLNLLPLDCCFLNGPTALQRKGGLKVPFKPPLKGASRVRPFKPPSRGSEGGFDLR